MKYVPIKELISEKISGEWGKKAVDDTAVRVIRTANFQNTGKINFDNIVLRSIDSRKIKKKLLQAGDIIIEKSGGSPTQPVGRVVYFETPDNEVYLCNNFTTILRPKVKNIFPGYLFYSLFYNYKIGKTIRYQNKTTGIINLKLDSYLKSKIYVPPMADQIRIANLLKKVEALTTKRKKSIEDLDELLKSTFLEIFGDPIRNEKGWEISTIDNLCAKIIDCPHKTPVYSELDTGFYCIRSSDIVDGYLELYNTKQVGAEVFEDRIKRHIPQKNDILYCREGGRLGNAARIISDDRICLGQRIMLFCVNEELRSHFFWALLESFPFKQKVNGLVGGGGAPRVNIKELKKIKTIKPPLKLQSQFASIVEKVESIKDLYSKSLSDLETLFGALSQKAFTGELDLSKVPVDVAIKEEPVKIGVKASADIKLSEKIVFTDSDLENLVKNFLSNPFSFDDLWDKIEKDYKKNIPPRSDVQRQLIKMLESGQSKLAQVFDNSAYEENPDENEKRIVFRAVNET